MDLYILIEKERKERKKTTSIRPVTFFTTAIAQVGFQFGRFEAISRSALWIFCARFDPSSNPGTYISESS